MCLFHGKWYRNLNCFLWRIIIHPGLNESNGMILYFKEGVHDMCTYLMQNMAWFVKHTHRNKIFILEWSIICQFGLQRIEIKFKQSCEKMNNKILILNLANSFSPRIAKLLKILIMFWHTPNHMFLSVLSFHN